MNRGISRVVRTAETGGPIVEQAAKRDVLRYVKGRVNGRDRWTDSRAGGYAGGK